MSLPPEIRVEIYAMLLLLGPYTHHINLSASPSGQVHTGLLLANRQINQEATYLLYEHNMFLAHHSMLTGFPRLRPWYPPIREPSAAARIRRFHLVVRLDCDISYTKEDARRSLSNLDELVVDVVQAMFLGVGYENLRVLEDVRGVKKVSIRGSTTGFEDYVAWLVRVMESKEGSVVERFDDGLKEGEESWLHQMNIVTWPWAAAAAAARA